MFVISQVGETDRVAKEKFYWNVTAGLLPGAHIRDAVLGVRERGGVATWAGWCQVLSMCRLLAL